jgi:hypothetical protein
MCFLEIVQLSCYRLLWLSVQISEDLDNLYLVHKFDSIRSALGTGLMVYYIENLLLFTVSLKITIDVTQSTKLKSMAPLRPQLPPSEFPVPFELFQCL